MPSEAEIKARIQIALSKDPSIRLFNIVTGQFWRGEVDYRESDIPRGIVVLRNASAVRTGCPGMSDLLGWKSITISPEMVGMKIAILTAVETKSQKGRPSDQQRQFIHVVSNAGGIAGIARSVEEAKLILGAR